MNILNREILKLAIPSILANITVPLVGIADIAVAGHLSGSAAIFIGGISIGSLLFDMLYWNFSFLRIGTGGMTAQAYGRDDMSAAAATLIRSVFVSMLIAISCILIQWAFVDFVFLFVKCSPDVRALAETYFHIRIWAAPATLTLMALKGWFIGMQNSVIPMATDLIVNGMNIAGSIILAMGLPAWGFSGIGFPGISVGTVAAQYSGLLFAVSMLMLRYRKKVFAGFSLKDARESFTGHEMKRFFNLNADLFIRSLAIMGIYAGITVISARYSDMMLAVSSILVQIMMIFSYFTDGFAYAGEALTGKFIGRRDKPAVRQTVRSVFAWSMGVAAVFMVLYAFFARPMLYVLTSDTEVVTASMEFIPWLIPMPIIGCAAFTWDGIYVGATASKPIRNSTLWAVLGFFIVWFAGYFILRPSPHIAVHILMAGFLVHLLIRMLYETVLYRRSILW
ncbi:MAG: MATE family efflux transporter [Bacteroides sp.]|nr:MATE family efflux transporter [Bacteroides sp.]